jgi:hypothetical protein
LLLLVGALVIGNALIGAALGIGLELFTWILSGTIVCLVACAILSAVFWLAWRITGVPVGWQRALSGAACLLAGGWIYLAAGLMCFALGLGLAQPGLFATILTRWRSGDAAAASQALAAVHGPALAGIVLASVVWLGGFVWAWAAWNGLRLAFGARAWQAVLAGAAASALLVGLVQLAAWSAG